MKSRKRQLLPNVRLHLPEKTGGAHGGKQGGKGYNRAREHRQFSQDLY